MIKKLKWAGLAVVVLVIAAVVLVVVNLNSFVRTVVETASTQSLGLKTTLGGASVSLLGGSVSLSDFKVASPAGFEAPAFIDVGGLGLQVGYSELRSDPIRVGNISVSKPRLVIEQKGLKLNLAAAMEAMPASDPNAKPPNLIVGTISVTGAEVVLRPGIPGLAQEIVVALPDLTVSDVGTGAGAENGVAIKKVVLTVAEEMARRAADSDKLPPEVRALLKSDLAGLKDRLRSEVQGKVDALKDQAQQQLNDVTGKAKEDAQKAVEKGLGGLLKKP